MSPPDLAALAGAFLAAVISGLGLRRGEAERRSLPAGDRSLPAGRDGRDLLHAILDGLHAIHADLSGWRRQDEMERRADRERVVEERFERIEADQSRILDLLGEPESDAPVPPRPR